MRSILFATTNKGKVISLQHRLSPLGIDVEQLALDLIEPQADTCKEISFIKAKQAFRQAKRPVVVDDSAFHIPALNGFPGPYVKYILKTLGAKGILKVADSISSRHAYFESSLTFITAEDEHRTFAEYTTKGVLKENFVPAHNPRAWSELWNIFSPYGSSKVLAQLTDDEILAIKKETKQKDTFTLFAEWLDKTYLNEEH